MNVKLCFTKQKLFKVVTEMKYLTENIRLENLIFCVHVIMFCTVVSGIYLNGNISA